MKKLFAILASMVLVCSAFAATNVANPMYSGKEFGVSLGTGYVVDTSNWFQDDYAFNLQAGVSYFVTRNVGFEFWLPFYTEGLVVQEVQAGLLFRFPLAKEASFWKRVAPYVGVGGLYNWSGGSFTDSNTYYVTRTEPSSPPCCGGDTDTETTTAVYTSTQKYDKADWAYILKAGTEFRFSSKFGAFAEAQYRNNDFDWEEGQLSVVGGVKIVF